MAIVTVTQASYVFTASVYTDQSPTVTDDNWLVTITANSGTSVSINNTQTVTEIISNGLLSYLTASTSTTDEFVGNGIQKTFTLTEEVLGSEYVEVSVGGVVQSPGATDSYTVRTTNTGSISAVSFIDFVEAPPSGLDILVQFFSVRTAFDIQGPQGVPGPFTNISVGTVTTSSVTATVTVSGTTGTKFLNFVLPYVVGPRGATGAQGPGASGLTWQTLPYTRGVDGPYEVTIGRNAGGTAFAGTSTPGPYGPYNGNISIGEEAGYQSQSTASIAIGYRAGYYLQGGPAQDPITLQSPAVAIGSEAGYTNQGDGAIAIGRVAGYKNQGDASVAIGRRAGTDTQSANAVAIGNFAAERRQGDDAVAIGSIAGRTDQGDYSVAIGPRAGNASQGSESVAIGIWASTSTQGFGSVSIGRYAGENNQGQRAVAIGNRAGSYNQGAYSVAIGGSAAQTNQHANTVVLNAQGSGNASIALNTDRSNAFFVKPVRRVISATQPAGFFQMLYNPTTGEIVYWTTS